MIFGGLESHDKCANYNFVVSAFFLLSILCVDFGCEPSVSLIVSQCVVRATASSFCDANDGHHSAQLLEISDNVLTDAIRLQVCCYEICNFVGISKLFSFLLLIFYSLYVFIYYFL